MSWCQLQLPHISIILLPFVTMLSLYKLHVLFKLFPMDTNFKMPVRVSFIITSSKSFPLLFFISIICRNSCKKDYWFSIILDNNIYLPWASICKIGWSFHVFCRHTQPPSDGAHRASNTISQSCGLHRCWCHFFNAFKGKHLYASDFIFWVTFLYIMTRIWFRLILMLPSHDDSH